MQILNKILKTPRVLLLVSMTFLWNCAPTSKKGPPLAPADTSSESSKDKRQGTVPDSDMDSLTHPGYVPYEPMEDSGMSASPEFSQAGRVDSLCGFMPGSALQGSYLKCAQDLYDSGALSEAQEVVQKINPQKDPTPYVHYHNLMGKILFQKGKFAEALLHFDSTATTLKKIQSAVNEAEFWSKIASLLSQINNAELRDDTRHIFQAFISGASHQEISQRALALLKVITEEGLRIEIKKLVQKAWERENSGPEINPENTDFTSGKGDSSSLPSENIKNTLEAADSLISLGQFLPAREILLSHLSGPQKKKTENLMNKAGRQFCTEKRKNAAEKFSASKSLKGEDKLKQLNLAKTELENCLTYFPHSPISNKVQENLNMVLQQISGYEREP